MRGAGPGNRAGAGSTLDDDELLLVAALHFATRERGGPLPSIDVAYAVLGERRKLTEWATTVPREFSQFRT